MKRLSTLLLILHSSFLILHSPAAVPLRWTVETSRVQPIVFDAIRGETLALEASFKSYGTDIVMTNETAFLCWQTNGMASAWWITNAVTSGSSASVLFTPDMDPGAPVVHCFLGLADTNTTLSTLSSTLYPLPSLSYRAAFTLRFRHGPGADPHELQLPSPTIDCAAVTFLNPESAPFSGSGCDTNAVNALIASATNGLATASITNGLASLSSLASYRPNTNNICHQTSTGGYTDWVGGPAPNGAVFSEYQPYFADDFNFWVWVDDFGGVWRSQQSDRNATELFFKDENDDYGFRATRSLITYATAGHTFVTEDYVAPSSHLTNMSAHSALFSSKLPTSGAARYTYAINISGTAITATNDASGNNIASTYRTNTNNTCHATTLKSYTEWVVNLPTGYTLYSSPTFDETYSRWNCVVYQVAYSLYHTLHSRTSTSNAVSITMSDLYRSVTATRTAINYATANHTFVTDDYVSNSVLRLNGLVCDFNGGTNLTKRIYETLTNIVYRLGGSVTNYPSFTN